MRRDELDRVEAHARGVAALGAERVAVGAFDAFLAAEGPSYAVPARPTGDATALAAELAELDATFRARGLPLRIELTLVLWPELSPALVAAGLTPVEETPLFVVGPEGFRPRSVAGLDVRWLAPEESPAFALALVRQGYELRGPPPSADEVAALRASLAGPLRLATATLDGLPAGAGFSLPLADTTELSGVTTLPTQRRRGVGAGLVSFLVARHFEAGGALAWAASDDPRAAALFYRVGFHDGGLRVAWVQRS
jgi:GNAT superfamily N-acetyltransferase